MCRFGQECNKAAVFRSVASGTVSRELLPEHEFFDCPRWDFLFNCDSYYNPGISVRGYEDGPRDIIRVSGVGDFKNYDDEILLFLDWVLPFASAYDEDAFLGYFKYEECQNPTLIFSTGACSLEDRLNET